MAEATIWNELSHASGLPHSRSGSRWIGPPRGERRVRRRARGALSRGAGRPPWWTGCSSVRRSDRARERCARRAPSWRSISSFTSCPRCGSRWRASIVYGQPMPPRFVRLLGRVLGPDSARRWAETHASVSFAGAPRGAVTDVTALAVTTPEQDETEDLCQLGANRTLRVASPRCTCCATGWRIRACASSRPASARSRSRPRPSARWAPSSASPSCAIARRSRSHRPGRRQERRARRGARASADRDHASRTSASGRGAGARGWPPTARSRASMAVRGASPPDGRDPARRRPRSCGRSPASTSVTTSTRRSANASRPASAGRPGGRRGGATASRRLSHEETDQERPDDA